MRFLLILCILASAGLVSGPADARLPGLEVRKERLERRTERQDERSEERRDEARRGKRREDRQDDRREERREDRREQSRNNERREDRREEHRNERREEDHEHYTPRRDRSAEAARRAQQRNGGGRVLSVDPVSAGYRVKVIKDGEVRVHHVEPDDQ